MTERVEGNMRQWHTVWRMSGIVGVAAAVVLAAGGLSMAAQSTTITENLQNEGTLTIQPSGSSSDQGTITWTWRGLVQGETVTVFDALKSDESDLQFVTSGTVTTNGTFTDTITLTPGYTWSNALVEVEAGAFAVGQLPEVPWAAALPLLLAVPFGIGIWRRAKTS
ncbi:MAG: hypothetical protein OWU84_10315 [Firmicutes bacterium]|nr:hypothetical protein [Bacillota bacterium]